MEHSAKKILALCNEAKECPICNVHFTFKNNKAFANGCLHCYCYHCISSWVQRRANCPLCRKSVEYIIKNVKSNNDYDIEEVVPPNNNSDQEGNLEHFGAADQESNRSPSTASVVSLSDSSESDEEYNESVPVQEPDNEVFSSASESDLEDQWETESEHGSDNNLPDSEPDDEGMSEHEYDSEGSEIEYASEMSEGEPDSDDSIPESGNDSSLNLPDFTSISDNDSSVHDFKSSNEELSSLSPPISSSASNQDSDEDVLSSDEQDVADDPSSCASNDSHDYYSSSSSDY